MNYHWASDGPAPRCYPPPILYAANVRLYDPVVDGTKPTRRQPRQQSRRQPRRRWQSTSYWTHLHSLLGRHKIPSVYCTIIIICMHSRKKKINEKCNKRMKPKWVDTHARGWIERVARCTRHKAESNNTQHTHIIYHQPKRVCWAPKSRIASKPKPFAS